MTYSIYLEELERRLSYLCGKGECIHRVQALKNNGVRMDGFSLQKLGRKEQPTVYVNQYFRSALTDCDLENYAVSLWKILRDSPQLPDEELSALVDYERIQEKIFCRLISREKNEELLGRIPWLPWMDLAVVFYIRVPDEIVRNATVLINQEQMRQWGVTMGQLYRRAYKNLLDASFDLHPMSDFFGDMGADALSADMYILSNEKREFGAAVILNPKALKTSRERLGEDFYILPSSIHEVILLPERLAAGRKELDRLIQEVNENCVSREEYLSGHAYLYSNVSGRLDF